MLELRAGIPRPGGRGGQSGASMGEGARRTVLVVGVG
jgi:hypothetical protein